MGKPYLTEFLLKLATESSLLDQFKGINETGQAEMMANAQLTAEQIEAVLTWDSRQIVEAVCEELESNASSSDGYAGTTLTIILPMDNLQRPTHLSE